MVSHSITQTTFFNETENVKSYVFVLLNLKAFYTKRKKECNLGLRHIIYQLCRRRDCKLLPREESKLVSKNLLYVVRYLGKVKNYTSLWELLQVCLIKIHKNVQG